MPVQKHKLFVKEPNKNIYYLWWKGMRCQGNVYIALNPIQVGLFRTLYGRREGVIFARGP